MFDGLALETKCSYCPERNMVLGICSEHGNRGPLEVTEAEAIDQIIRFALLAPPGDKSKVSFGNDATVAWSYMVTG